MKITQFTIGKYKGFSIRFLIFKFERIGFGKKFMWRFELAYGWDD